MFFSFLFLTGPGWVCISHVFGLDIELHEAWLSAAKPLTMWKTPANCVTHAWRRFTDGLLPLVSWCAAEARARIWRKRYSCSKLNCAQKNYLSLLGPLIHWQQEVKCVHFISLTAKVSFLLQEMLYPKRIRCPFITAALRDANPHQSLFVAGGAMTLAKAYVKALTINVFRKPHSATFQWRI